MATAESAIFCAHKVSFGSDCLISWENLIMDTDVHKVFCHEEQTNHDREISIGNHVWIGCRCTILKGSRMPDNTVIAAGSLICRPMSQSGCVMGGNPLQVIKKEIEWSR